MPTIKMLTRGKRTPFSTRQFGWALMAFSAVIIALVAVMPSLRFNSDLSRIPLNTAFVSHFLWLALHAVPSSLALIIGPFQFVPSLRTRWPKAHRYAGRLYLACVIAGSIAAIAATRMSTAGFATQVGFSLLIFGWLYSAYHAYQAARERRFVDHRIWMIRNYAFTFAAVWLRIFLLLGIASRQMGSAIPFDQIYTASAWASILVSSVLAEWFLVPRVRRPA
ncbi:MAG: DUF2306 domain-containing protein [Rhodanobacter sp.]